MCSIETLRHIDKAKLADGNWFNIFLSLCCYTAIFKRLFTISKSREEIELQEGTPEVLKNLRNWQYVTIK
jgi:hypothetical protein